MAVGKFCLGVVVFILMVHLDDSKESDKVESVNNDGDVKYLMELLLAKREKEPVRNVEQQTYYRDDAADLDKRFLCGNYGGSCQWRACCKDLYCDRTISGWKNWKCKTCITSGAGKTGSKCIPHVSDHCCAEGSCKKTGYFTYRCVLP